MNRRGFFQLLASIPFVGYLVPSEAVPMCESLTVTGINGYPLSLGAYLHQLGWADDIAADAHTIYYETDHVRRYCLYDCGWEDDIRESLGYLDDDEHDYTGELSDDVREWQRLRVMEGDKP